MSLSSYVENIDYSDSTILVRINYRSEFILSYLEGIEGAVSSDEKRTWSIPLRSLSGFYKFSVRWGVPLPEKLLVDVEQRIIAGEELPVLLDIFKNQRRTRLCRKRRLPILDDLKYLKRSGSFGSWQRRGRYAIASPAERKIILDAEKAAIEKTRQCHVRWLSTHFSEHHFCCAFSTIGQELVRLYRQEEDMEYKANTRSYDEGASLFLSRAKQSAERRRELRKLYDLSLELFIIQNSLMPLARVEITSDHYVDLYECEGRTLYSFNLRSDELDDDECQKLNSRNCVSLERSVFILISYLRTKKNSLKVDTPSGTHYAAFLSSFVREEGNDFLVNTENILEMTDFDQLSNDGLSGALRSIYALGHEISVKAWVRYFINYDLNKLRTARHHLPKEAASSFDNAVKIIEKMQRFQSVLKKAL